MILTAVTAGEVMLDWYRSESNRWRDYRAAFEAAHPDLTETQLANAALRYIRGPFFRRKSGEGIWFDAHPTDWFKADVPVSVLANSKPINCFELPNARSVRDVAMGHAELSLIRITRDDLKHRPILVTTAPQDLPMLLDGYHRAAGLIHTNEQRTIPVYYGICKNLDDWWFYW